MTEAFNAYQAFLGLEDEHATPNYYELLRLPAGESDSATIAAAADRATTRVRSHRPGANAATWSRLLDEIKAARSCLLDAGQRRAYDEQLRSGSGAVGTAGPNAPGATNPAGGNKPLIAFESVSQTPAYAYPPGLGPKVADNVAPTAAPSPAAANPAMFAPAVPASALPASVAPATGGFPPLPSGFPPTAADFAQPSGASLDPMAPVSYAPRIDPMQPVAAYQQAPAEVMQAEPVPSLTVAHAPSGSFGNSRKSLLVMMLGTLAGLLVLTGLGYIAWQNLNKTDNFTDNSPVLEPQPSPTPTPAVKPEPKVEEAPFSPAPEPMPMVVAVVPEPMPEPEMKPEVVKPEPVKPEPEPEPTPTPEPTAEELAELTHQMKEAKGALGTMGFEQAEEHLANAEKLAQITEHKEKVERLKEVAGLAKQFHEAIAKTMQGLEFNDEIKIGSSTQAIVVESSPTKLVIRVAAQNRTHTLEDMPLGLAVSLGEQSLNQGDPKTRVLKGAYVLVHEKGDGQINKVKGWWEEAQLSGVDIRHLMPVLTDKYDFEKDAPEQ